MIGPDSKTVWVLRIGHSSTDCQGTGVCRDEECSPNASSVLGTLGCSCEVRKETLSDIQW